MRIVYKSDGGLAYLPNLQKPVDVDVDRLDAAAREELLRLVQDARFFELPATVGSLARGAADHTVETLTVEDEGRRHSVRLVSVPAEGPLQSLRTAVLAQVKAIRAGSKKSG